MNYQGVLTKMQTELGYPIQYYLVFKDDFLNVNQLLDKKVTINFEGYQCLNCGKTKKIYRQGFCYDCFYKIPQAADWIIKPELSKAHLNIEDRDLDYEKAVQLKPHIVYLANSSNVKVGVTRKTQVPTRWIDQGAAQALPIYRVKTRYQSGLVEVAFKAHVSDRTDWRKMLKSDAEPVDLHQVRQELMAACSEDIMALQTRFGEGEITPLSDESIVDIRYPVDQYPEKVKSLNFDKTPEISGLLQGIKGQYLILDIGVLNIRKFSGYQVKLESA